MAKNPLSDAEVRPDALKANAFQRAIVRLNAWYRRLQESVWEEPKRPTKWPYKIDPLPRFTQTARQGTSSDREHRPPPTQPDESGKSEQDSHSVGECGIKGQMWEDIEISFLSDERVQINIGEWTETCNYAELGFSDNRSGKPNQGWGMLRALAVAGGTIPNSARNSADFIKMGKRIERVRKTLMKYFRIPSDPITLDPPKGYRCRFKIGCHSAFKH
ncbi:MAG: hypothetical protein ABSH24_34400 [Bryobacteraceae bacterium]|jgi:hypothetical protein